MVADARAHCDVNDRVFWGSGRRETAGLLFASFLTRKCHRGAMNKPPCRCLSGYGPRAIFFSDSCLLCGVLPRDLCWRAAAGTWPAITDPSGLRELDRGDLASPHASPARSIDTPLAGSQLLHAVDGSRSQGARRGVRPIHSSAQGDLPRDHRRRNVV